MARRALIALAASLALGLLGASSAAASSITPTVWPAGYENETKVIVHDADCNGYDIHLFDELQARNGFGFPGAAFYEYEPTLLDEDIPPSHNYVGEVLVPLGAFNGVHRIVAICQENDANVGEFNVTITGGKDKQKQCKPGFVSKGGQCERKGPENVTPGKGHHDKHPGQGKHHHPHHHR